MRGAPGPGGRSGTAGAPPCIAPSPGGARSRTPGARRGLRRRTAVAAAHVGRPKLHPAPCLVVDGERRALVGRDKNLAGVRERALVDDFAPEPADEAEPTAGVGGRRSRISAKTSAEIRQLV